MEKNFKARVFNSLLEDILYLHLAPGQKIDEIEIAEKYGMSRTPVREALLDLKSFGLVKIIPRNGTYVSEIDYSDILKTLRVKNRLEGLVAELATSNLTPNDIGLLELSLIKASELNQPDYIKIMLEVDMNFHAVIHKKCFNEVLLNSLERLQYKCFRAWYFLTPNSNEITEMISSLKLVLEAFKRRDPIDARTKMEDHAELLLRMIGNIAN